MDLKKCEKLFFGPKLGSVLTLHCSYKN